VLDGHELIIILVIMPRDSRLKFGFLCVAGGRRTAGDQWKLNRGHASLRCNHHYQTWREHGQTYRQETTR